MSFSLPLQPSPLFFRSFASSSTPSGMTIRIAAALSTFLGGSSLLALLTFGPGVAGAEPANNPPPQQVPPQQAGPPGKGGTTEQPDPRLPPPDGKIIDPFGDEGVAARTATPPPAPTPTPSKGKRSLSRKLLPVRDFGGY